MRKKFLALFLLIICIVYFPGSYVLSSLFSVIPQKEIQNKDISLNASRLSNIENLHKFALLLENEDFANKILLYSSYFIEKPFDREIEIDLIKWDKNRDKSKLINIQSFDCFSYIEMVVALAQIKRPSISILEFKRQVADNLAKNMFSSRKISYISKNHFMEEWLKNNDGKDFIIKNVLADLSYAKIKTANINKAGLLETRITNYANDNLPASEWLPFTTKYDPIKLIKTFKSNISYISFFDFLKHEQELIKQLKSKVYIITIIIDNPKMLELTKTECNIGHVGFVLTKNDKFYFRHATFADPKSVIEIPLEEYANSKKESKIFLGFTLFSIDQK